MLTDAAIRKAKPKAKAYKLADGGGLFLLVTPTGGKWWRFKYRRPVTRKENLLAFGTYPETSLADARAKREEAKKLLKDGIDPGQQRKAEKLAGAELAANTFEAVAREWLGVPADVLEAQLAHAKKDEVQKAYDRTAFIMERHKAMQAWADYLDSLRAGVGNVVAFNLAG